MRIPKRLSPATVISCVALAVALAGTSYAAVVLPANSVGTAQLKANAVTAAKVKDGSLLARDLRTGQYLAADVVVRTTSSSPTAAGVQVVLRVMCEPGELALGGGAGLADRFGGDEDLLQSYPLEADESAAEDGDTPAGWSAEFTSTGPSFSPTAYVVCAPS
jgi:hypothetical protein